MAKAQEVTEKMHTQIVGMALMTNDDGGKLYTDAEIAEAVGVSPWTVWKYKNKPVGAPKAKKGRPRR